MWIFLNKYYRIYSSVFKIDQYFINTAKSVKYKKLKLYIENLANKKYKVNDTFQLILGN